MKKKLIQQSGGAVTLNKRDEKRFPHSLGDVDRQANASMYYGFTPIRTPELREADHAKAKVFADKKKAPLLPANGPAWSPAEKVAVLRTYAENAMHDLPQPVMLYYKKPLAGSGERKSQREVHCGLDIIGTGKPVAEAMVIAAAVAMARDDGHEAIVVELNCVGERDAMTKHERELGNFLKKHHHALPAKWRQEFRSDPFMLLSCCDPELDNFKESAPKSVNYLGEAGRRHFMEVLEHLEALEIPYRINHALVGHRAFASHVLFEIKSMAQPAPAKPSSTSSQASVAAATICESTIAIGSRYNFVSRKLDFRKEVPAIGATILYRRPETENAWKPITNPKFYFVQFGDAARLKSLKIIEMLRRERISTYHSLTKDKLVAQIAAAENLKVPYILIMGQKEALENSVVVRDLNTRAQETVDLKNLVPYLRKLR